MSAQRNRPVASHALILCHPAFSSFNHAVANAYADAVIECGQSVVVRDLCAMRFDPVLKAGERPSAADFALSADVVAEQEKIRECDAFVLVYPIWFGTPPALLKGFVERVLGAGILPGPLQAGIPHSFLTGKRLVSFSSSGTSEAWLNEQGELSSLRTLFDRYLSRTFGMRSEQHFHFANIVPGLKPRFVSENLAIVRTHARRICGELMIEHFRTRAGRPALQAS